jgi:hypothetical protein
LPYGTSPCRSHVPSAARRFSWQSIPHGEETLRPASPRTVAIKPRCNETSCFESHCRA